jgi:hypothetical protein
VPFHSIQEAEQRLQNPQTLAEQEVTDLTQWMHLLSDGSRLRLQAHLAMGNVRAIETLNETSAKIEGAVRRMDEGSTRFGIAGLRLNIALFVLTVTGTLLAAFAARIADKSYKDANTSSIQQQQTLDASRRSLESASQALNQLTGLVKKESESLDQQLTIAESNQKRELERLSRKPEIEILSSDNCPLDPVFHNPVLVFKSAWIGHQFKVPTSCGGHNVGLEVLNKGNLVAHHLVVRCDRKTYPFLRTEARQRGVVSSPEVTLNLQPVGSPNPNVHATKDYILLGPIDLWPIAQERRTELIVLESNVPSNVGSYQVFCEVDEELIGHYNFSFVVAKESVRPQ